MPTIEDNDPDIAPEDGERVFDRFYRAPVATGSDLGLAIVHAIAQSHGASLELDQSQRLGGLRILVRVSARLP